LSSTSGSPEARALASAKDTCCWNDGVRYDPTKHGNADKLHQGPAEARLHSWACKMILMLPGDEHTCKATRCCARQPTARGYQRPHGGHRSHRSRRKFRMNVGPRVDLEGVTRRSGWGERRVAFQQLEECFFVRWGFWRPQVGLGVAESGCGAGQRFSAPAGKACAFVTVTRSARDPVGTGWCALRFDGDGPERSE